MIKARHVYFCIGFLLLSLVSFISGCGYHLFNSKCLHSATPFSVTIKPMTNHTSYPDMDRIVGDYMIEELASWPQITIKEYKEAEYVLSGAIDSYTSQIPYTYDSNKNPLEYKLTLTISLALNKKEEGKKTAGQLATQLQEEEIYRFFPSDLGRSKLSEWQAMRRAVKRMTKRAMDQLIGMEEGCY
jgi:outer membrane lipopolysaccharide assembly protein LptE/RlpB